MPVSPRDHQHLDSGAQPSSSDNPAGTDGFEFVEYTAPDPELLRTLFERLAFRLPRVIAARM